MSGDNHNQADHRCHGVDRCHRIGTAQFVPWGSEGWECANDRACNRRVAIRGEASP